MITIFRRSQGSLCHGLLAFSSRGSVFRQQLALSSTASYDGDRNFQILLTQWRDERTQWRDERTQWREEQRQWMKQQYSYGETIGKLKSEALYSLDEKLRAERNFNVRGAVERIVYHAALEGQIGRYGGVQDKLNKLAQSPEYSRILHSEVESRKLVLKDAEACVSKVYHELSKHAHGNSTFIELDHRQFTPNEFAALVSFFRLQSNWEGSLEWQEI